MMSVIMPYFNRPEVLTNTLWAYDNLGFEGEFIIVDDKSSKPPALQDLPELNIKCITINRPGSNPCVPFNVGVRAAEGDTIILSNPECLPISPNLKLPDGTPDYAIARAYSVSHETQMLINALNPRSPNYINAILQNMTFHDRAASAEGEDAWYAHPDYNPRPFHWWAVMPKALYVEMGGFDEDFRMGVAWEDNDWIRRLAVHQVPVCWLDATVLHQYHYNRPGQQGKQNEGIFWQKANVGGWRANEERDWGRNE